MAGNIEDPLAIKKHIKYFKRFLNLLPGSLSSHDSTRLTIAFFAISGLEILDALGELSEEDKKNICDWIYRLQILPTEDGNMSKCGFQGSNTLNIKTEQSFEYCNPEYVTGHVAMTYTGLASLVILGDDLSRANRTAIIQGVRALQQEDGSFCATQLGCENDMRFVYCAACVCYILQDWSGMDIPKTIDYITKSMSYDYGFAQGPELESHGGVTFCGVATLKLMGKLEEALTPKQLEGLKRWALFRQVSGFQGRANKPVDTCYSFWVGGTLKMLDSYHFVNFSRNREYVMTTQDSLTGGFSKWADSYPDPMHTYLGLCGLSLMGEEGLIEVNPELNISKRAVKHLHNLHNMWTNNSIEEGLQNIQIQ